MKKLSTFLLIITFLVPSLSQAAVPPWGYFCEDNGYTLEEDGIKSPNNYCVFDDGNKCPVQDFYNKSCGTEYLTETTNWECKQEGEFYFGYGDKCCDGLTTLRPWNKKMIGQSQCNKLSKSELFWANLFQKIDNLFISIKNVFK